MTLTEAWMQLHRTRFPELPLDCGNDADAGIIYGEDLRDWSDKATTPDQLRIERYIDRFDLRQKRVLHIGIGNSGLAKRFSGRVREIVGTTIDDPEVKVAEALHLPNYRVLKHNKYSGASEQPTGKFAFIIDNNPTSPCCCLRHLAALCAFYEAKLAPEGQVVTDQEGLGWVPDDANPRWSFDFEDLRTVAEASGLSAHMIDRSVYVLARSNPGRPHGLPLFRHRLRQAAAAPRQILGRTYRLLRRLGGALKRSALRR